METGFSSEQNLKLFSPVKIFVITIMYYIGSPVAYELKAKNRSEALRNAWDNLASDPNDVYRITAVLK